MFGASLQTAKGKAVVFSSRVVLLFPARVHLRHFPVQFDCAALRLFHRHVNAYRQPHEEKHCNIQSCPYRLSFLQEYKEQGAQEAKEESRTSLHGFCFVDLNAAYCEGN